MCIYQPLVITEEIEQRFKPTRLAIKELNGLKYFCKSVRKNFDTKQAIYKLRTGKSAFGWKLVGLNL